MVRLIIILVKFIIKSLRFKNQIILKKVALRNDYEKSSTYN